MDRISVNFPEVIPDLLSLCQISSSQKSIILQKDRSFKYICLLCNLNWHAEKLVRTGLRKVSIGDACCHNESILFVRFKQSKVKETLFLNW